MNTHYNNDINNGIKDTDCLLSIKLIPMHVNMIINNIKDECNIDINNNESIKSLHNEKKIINCLCNVVNNMLGLQQFMKSEDFKDTIIESEYCNFIYNVSYDLSYLTLPLNTNNDYYIYFEYDYVNNDNNNDIEDIEDKNIQKTKLTNIYIIVVKDYKLFMNNYFTIFDKIYFKELMVRFIPKLMYIMRDKDKDYIINEKLTIPGYNSSLQKKEKIKALLNIL